MGNSFVSSMKSVALKGGENGPLFDRDVLDVVEQVETNGYLVPTDMRCIFRLLNDQKSIPGFKGSPMDQCGFVTKEEMEQAKEFLAKHGWTFEQGLEYMDGVEYAENMIPEKSKKPTK